MSSVQLPNEINPIALAHETKKLEGLIAVQSLKRLTHVAGKQHGEVYVVVDFGKDANGLNYFSARINTQLSLVCQRCLDSMEQKVTTQFKLYTVTNQMQFKLIPNDVDALFIGDEPFLLHDIIEDELIVSLPMFAKHQNEKDCNLSDNSTLSADSTKRKPFANLAQLVTLSDNEEFENGGTTKP